MFDIENMQKYFQGLNKFYEKYQSRTDIKFPIIFERCSCQVIDYTISNSQNITLLFIPSLINKSYILDLDDNTSMVKFFASLGFRVLLLNFLDPLDSELHMKLDNYISVIDEAIESTTFSQRFFTIGYCFGGILSLFTKKPPNFLGQILIATPIDFSHFQRFFHLNNSFVFESFKNSISFLERIPHLLIKMFFSSIDPAQIWQKFSVFANAQDPEEIEKFILLEQWVNDGINLTKPFVFECLEIINSNSLEVKLSSQHFEHNTLIINGSDDKIVPIESSIPLYKNIINKEIIVEPTGHVGLIIGKSKDKIRQDILTWIGNNSS